MEEGQGLGLRRGTGKDPCPTRPLSVLQPMGASLPVPSSTPRTVLVPVPVRAGGPAKVVVPVAWTSSRGSRTRRRYERNRAG